MFRLLLGVVTRHDEGQGQSICGGQKHREGPEPSLLEGGAGEANRLGPELEISEFTEIPHGNPGEFP